MSKERELLISREAFGLVRVMIARQIEYGFFRTQAEVVRMVLSMTLEQCGLSDADAQPPAQAVTPPSHAHRLVEAQARDEGLWFVAQTAPEAYLQQALRALHEAVESQPPAQDEWVRVPKSPAAACVESMCFRYRHDFGLEKPDDDFGCGTTERERDDIRSQMRQLYEEATGQGFYKLPTAPGAP